MLLPFHQLYIDLHPSTLDHSKLLLVIRLVYRRRYAKKNQTSFHAYPDNTAERQHVMQGFSEISQIPGVIGGVDGTHVEIVNFGGPNSRL